jgi:hypothetical protein
MPHRRNDTCGAWRYPFFRITCAVSLSFPAMVWSADAVILDVRGYAQEAEQWCWAASGQAVMEFLDPELTNQVCQCHQAELRLAGLKCCASANSCAPMDPLDPLCRDPGWPDFGRFGFDFRTTCNPLPESDWHQCVGEPLTWGELRHEIGSARPVVFSQRPADQPREVALGHAMIAFGYMTTTAQAGEKRWVLVFDPKSVCRNSCERTDPPCCRGDASWFSYDDYRETEGFSHWNDFFGLRRKTSSKSVSRSSRPPP